MSKSLLLKGFEVELFTGRSTGEHVGIASEVKQNLSDFVIEPDCRNLEYITAPQVDYLHLKESLLTPRRTLRKWLEPRKLTIFPASTLSLGNSRKFERSDPFNEYHSYIESTYGTRVVTASIHINLGIEDLSMLFSALRLVRCEAALFLALSASSPFLDGLPTGAHSQRWLQFPRTPVKVPLFLNHSEYVQWVEEQLDSGIMLNERHLWTSVRPNGPHRPYELNRLELRICDLLANCDLLLALTSLLELRILGLFRSMDKLDPLEVSQLTSNELADLSDKNDIAVAEISLDATLFHWRDGKEITCRDWIEELIEEVMPLAVEMNMVKNLDPIKSVLNQGNLAMKWLQKHSFGQSVSSIIQDSIKVMEAEEINASNAELILG